MDVLIVLAYNEQLNLEKSILKNIETFDRVLVVNDKSTDKTAEILEQLSNKFEKISVITNKKNFGPGKSLNIGMREALKYNPELIIKIDGDNQFKPDNIREIQQLAKENSSDFIKCDRFWPGGIKGNIPKIRFFGNAFASLLIKAITGNWNITDPLNGLFVFSNKVAKEINVPKLFNRYGYPYFINLTVSKYNIKNPINLHQYKNTITYANESSKLSPFGVFVKLIGYSFVHFISTIKTKLQFSNYQISGLIDIGAVFVFLSSFISFYMFIISRYFQYPGNQHTWFLLFIVSIVLFIVLMLQSHKSMKTGNDESFKYLN